MIIPPIDTQQPYLLKAQRGVGLLDSFNALPTWAKIALFAIGVFLLIKTVVLIGSGIKLLFAAIVAVPIAILSSIFTTSDGKNRDRVGSRPSNTLSSAFSSLASVFRSSRSDRKTNRGSLEYKS